MLDASTPNAVRKWITDPPDWFHVVSDLVPSSQDQTLQLLDDGERAAILLALSMEAALLLMDDRAGMSAARDRGLIVTGTLGILKLAAIRKLVDIEPAITRLLATNFRYSPILIEQLLEDLRKNR